MPKILEDRRKAIARSNPKLSESSTWAIATSALQKEGKMPRKRFEAGGPTDDDPPPGRMTLTPAERRLERQTGIAAQQLNRDIPTREDDGGEAERMRLQTPNSTRVYDPGVSSFRKGGTVMGRRLGSFAQGGPPLPRSK